jgi:hypothetical protein
MIYVVLIALICALILALVRSRYLAFRREAFVRQYRFPPGLFKKLQEQHPQLSIRDCQLVSRALRQFFLSHLKSKRRFVSMPSQVTDSLWHEFILYTKAYQEFCSQAFGDFMHHSPAVSLGKDKQGNEGLRRCWWYSCQEENINPKTPSRLPLLFAIDSKLAIANGFSYVPDCASVKRLNTDKASSTTPYCAGDFSSSSVDGGTDGFGDSGDSSGSDSGGDGGSGCGGGGD